MGTERLIRSACAAIALLTVAGCAGPASIQKQAQRLQPGMPAEVALPMVHGSPMVRQIEGLPDITIYDYGDCTAWKGCQGTSLVFVEGRYHGPALGIEALRQPERLVIGTPREAFGRYGAVPSRIVRSTAEGPFMEAWLYDYLEQSDTRRRLIVYFQDDRLVNWIDLVTGSPNIRKRPWERDGGHAEYLLSELIIDLFFLLPK